MLDAVSLYNMFDARSCYPSILQKDDVDDSFDVKATFPTIRRRECSVCNKEAKNRCGGCLKKWYCGKECQKTDWKASHKSECSKNTEDVVYFPYYDLDEPNATRGHALSNFIKTWESKATEKGVPITMCIASKDNGRSISVTLQPNQTDANRV